MKNVHLLLASTSTLYGGKYLDYLEEAILQHFGQNKELIFIPFARPGGLSYDDYTRHASQRFEALGYTLRGLHTFENKAEALRQAQGLFTGGGNSFVLLKTLYDMNLMGVLREVVLGGTPYMGSSAGSNLAGLSIGTTNDMPIVWPSALMAIGAIPFNINPHYLDPQPQTTHMGETRETRIKEFHVFNEQGVMGLREGSWLEVKNASIYLMGDLSARWFKRGEEPTELMPGLLNFLKS